MSDVKPRIYPFINRRAARRIALVTFSCSILLLLGSSALLISKIDSSQDLVLVRNSLLMRVDDGNVFEWDPKSPPPTYRQETIDPSPFISQIDPQIIGQLDSIQDHFKKAQFIAQHIVANRVRPGIPIKSDTLTSYQRIRNRGHGYCADFTQVFNAFAYGAGLSVREWGMSFDGYGGDGHAFNEIYYEPLSKWIFIDSFYSFYVENELDEPMSVLELRDALLNHDAGKISIRPIDPQKFFFKTDEHALTYYRRGMSSLFMVWGNNVLSYDSHPVVRASAAIGRAGEQMTAILVGIQPDLVASREMVNVKGLSELNALRYSLLIALTALISMIMSGGLWLWSRDR